MSEDNQAEEIEASAPEPKPEPLFTLDLGANGGVLAPTSYAELKSWIETELAFWGWASRYSYHASESDPEYRLKLGLKMLHQAQQHLVDAEKNKSDASKGEDKQKNLIAERSNQERCQSRIRETYVGGKFPHSSTPTAKRIQQLQASSGDISAFMYAAVYLQPVNAQNSIYGESLSGWRGLVEGLIDRYDLIGEIAAGRQKAAETSFEELCKKADRFVTDTDQVCNKLHQKFENITKTIEWESVRQAANFDDWGSEFEKLTRKHQQDVDNIRKTFKEDLALAAPVSYWERKQDTHRKWSRNWGGASFIGIAAAAGGLGLQIHDLLKNTPANTAPETWRLAVLALVAVFTVWGVRLIVRLFLSHQHLYTDAQERITMVQTYLSLMEGEHLASRNDRQLILQALFRPASDGLVKDEGVPFSLAEVITRQGKP